MSANFKEALRKDGSGYAHIREFAPGMGFGCNCICPKCGKRVGSRINRNPVSSCFFHEGDVMNESCNGGGPETVYHLFSKRIFEEHSRIFLPHPSGNGRSVIFNYIKVRFEKKLDGFRPDLILESIDGEKLIIENTVTHQTFNSPLKMSKIKESGIPAVELTIDRNLIFPHLADRSESSYKRFCQFYTEPIIHDISSKKWLPLTDCELLLVENKNNEPRNSSDLWIWLLWLLFFLFVANSLLQRRESLPANRKIIRRANRNNYKGRLRPRAS